MTGQQLSYLIPFLISLAIALGIGLYTWRHRAVTGATPWAVVALSEALWILGYIFELISPDLDGKIFWDNVQFLGMFVIPTAFLAFALDYTGRRLPASKQIWATLKAAPILLTFLVFTDGWHHLIRPDARLIVLRGEPFAALTYSFTAAFWLLSAYSFALALAGLAILVDRFIRPRQFYRGQVGIILLGTLIPIVSGLFTLAGITHYFYRDTTPFAFALSNLVLVWGLFRYRLFDIVPIARDTVIESMRDAVIVLDVQGRVIDVNPAIQRLIGRQHSQVIGQKADRVFANWPDLVEKYQHVEEARSEMTVQIGETRYQVEMNLMPLYDQHGSLKGRLVVARDITERQQAQEALQRAHDELEQRVQERTLELRLANEQLQRESVERQQAQEALRENERRFRTIFDSINDAIFVHDLTSGDILDVNQTMCEMYGYTREEARQVSVGDLSAGEPPYTQQEAREWMNRATEGAPQLFEWWARHKSGRLFWVEVNMRRAAIGGHDRLLVVVRDITERKQAEAANQRRVALLTTLNQTALDLSAQLDLQTLLRAIIERAAHLIDAPMGTLWLLQPDGTTLEQVYSYNVPSQDMASRLRMGEELAGRVAATGEPLVLDDYGQWPGRDPRLEDLPYRAMLSVPIKWQNQVLGAIGAIDTQPSRFGPEQVETVSLLAAQAAVAIQNARLYTELQESERTLRALLNATADQAFLLDTTGIFLALNEAFAKSRDKSVQELLGARAYDLLPPDLAQARRARIEQVISSGDPLRFEDVGTNRGWYDNSIYPVFDAHGRVARVAIFARDITQRKRAEEQIRKLNRTLQMINEVNQTLVRATEEADLLKRVCQMIVESGGYRLAWVGRVELDETTLQGVRPAAVAGHDQGFLDQLNLSWADTGWGGDPIGAAIRTGQPAVIDNLLTDPRFSSWREQALQHGYAASIVLPLLSYGRAFGVLQIYAAEPEAFDAEEVKLLTEMADDLTYGIVALRTRAEHQQAEEQIKRLNQDLERRARGLAALNQSSQVMASTLDLDTLLKLVIEQIRRLLDVEAAFVLLCPPAPNETGIVGSDCSELVFAAVTGPGSERLKDMRLPITVGFAGWVVRERRAALVADARGDPRFYPLIDSATGMTTHSVLAVPLIARGAMLGVIEVVNGIVGPFDQHDRQVLEALSSSAAIAFDNARLYTTEQQRAAALARALEQQRRLDQLQREFMQNVSHELRTPLALIRGYAEMLDSGEMGELTPEQKMSIGVISRRSQILTEMVNDIVSVLEIEQRKLIRELIDLTQLTLTALADFRATAKNAGLVLSGEIAPDVPQVWGDTIALRRVLDNLIGNALKFTPAGGRVTVRLRHGEDTLTLEVADTGIGIPADQLDRIFERFYQVDGSATRRYGGMGLGLALVKGIVEAHGGQIAVTSEMGVGTTFSVRLPQV